MHATSDETNEILISAASTWKNSTKCGLGKLPSAELVALDMSGTIADQGFVELPISVHDAVRAGALPGPHRDPFDRMLVAQALAHNLALISIERCFDPYSVRRVW